MIPVVSNARLPGICIRVSVFQITPWARWAVEEVADRVVWRTTPVTYRLVETRPTRFRIFAAANRVSSRRQDLRASSLHRRILPTLLLVLLSSIGASTVVAEESSRDEMRSLDEQA
jgi:hypothetical protein